VQNCTLVLSHFDQNLTSCHIQKRPNEAFYRENTNNLTRKPENLVVWKKCITFEASNQENDVCHHANHLIKTKIISIMKKSVIYLLTIVSIAVAYFIGHNLVALFQWITSIGQDEIFGLFAMAIPAIKVKSLKYPISLVDYTAKSGKTYKGVVLGTENGKLSRELWYLACHSNFQQGSLFMSNVGYSTELKKPVYLLKKDYSVGLSDTQIIANVQSFLNEGLKGEQATQIATMISTKDAEKASAKEAKQGSKKGAKVTGIAEQVAKLDIALERGLITQDEHKAKLALALGI
jgi:hypothetical protein